MQRLSQTYQNVSNNHLFKTFSEYFLIILGSLIQALAMRLFLIPGLLVSGGISGAAQLVNFATGFPVGLMTLLGNIPLFILGWHYLGKLRFALRTAVAVIVFSLLTDALLLFIPIGGVTNDLVLDTLYGGLVLGVGLGLVYRGQGTSGGSDILSRILNHRFNMSISQTYLIGDGLVVLASGFVFGWERALYGLGVIYISGLAAEMILEGSSVLRTAMIVTGKPHEIAGRVVTELERGVTQLPGTGAYTGAERPVLYIVVTRAEVSQLKALVSEIDPQAFMVIGTAHEALGEGFTPLLKKSL
ncbi:MAG: YitT family protein [Anaerolineae bacterium]|nr:YitT family protein [Anaerolineae bacterium]